MTDKQIIIDGVDVSGCEHYDEVCLGNHHYKWCKDNEDCYYKQLKRVEQKLEKIKQFRHDYCMNCEDLLKSSHSCCGCNMSILRHFIEE